MIPVIIFIALVLYFLYEARVDKFRKSLKEGDTACYYDKRKKVSGEVKKILRSEYIENNKLLTRITFVQVNETLVLIKDIYP